MALLMRLHSILGRLKSQYARFSPYDMGGFVLNQITPRKHFQQTRNIAYGLKARQRLDLYYAAKPRVGQPLLLFVHGGAWQSGDKKDYVFLAESFCREGFNVAVINYHLAPRHIFPDYVTDLALAFNFLQAQQQKLKICTEQTVLMGHSAGAFNVMSLLYPPQNYAQQIVLKNLSHIKAVIGLAGPYHFDYMGDPLSQDAFDLNIPYQQVMPNYFVKPNAIQHYLLVAENDSTVAAHNSTALHDALLQQGNHSHIAVIAGTGHVSLLVSLASVFSRYFNTKRSIMCFLQEALTEQALPTDPCKTKCK